MKSNEPDSFGPAAPDTTSPDNRPSQRRQVLPWVAIVAIAGAVLLWFNRFSMSQMGLGDGVSIPVRTSRFTGESEMLVYGRWEPVAASSAATRNTTFYLPAEELGKIQARAGISWAYGQISGTTNWTLTATVYNGTSRPLSEIVAEYTLSKTSTQSALAREYTLLPTSGSPAPPLSSADFAARIDFAPELDTWSWRIVRASAIR